MRGRSWVSVWVFAAIGLGFAAYGQFGELQGYDHSFGATNNGHDGHVAMFIAMLLLLAGAIVGAAKALLDWQAHNLPRQPPQSGG